MEIEVQAAYEAYMAGHIHVETSERVKLELRLEWKQLNNLDAFVEAALGNFCAAFYDSRPSNQTWTESIASAPQILSLRSVLTSPITIAILSDLSLAPDIPKI